MYGGETLPEFLPWIQANIGADVNRTDPMQDDMEIDAPIINHAFLEALGEESFDRRSFLKWERIMHSHGASLKEVYSLRYGRFERYVDVVIYPDSTKHVEKIVELANTHNVIIIPYGGGTNVT